jgi:hypothetical protein
MNSRNWWVTKGETPSIHGLGETPQVQLRREDEAHRNLMMICFTRRVNF